MRKTLAWVFLIVIIGVIAAFGLNFRSSDANPTHQEGTPVTVSPPPQAVVICDALRPDGSGFMACPTQTKP